MTQQNKPLLAKLKFTYLNGKEYHVKNVVNVQFAEDAVIYSVDGRERKGKIDKNISYVEYVNGHYTVPTHDLAAVEIIKYRDEQGNKDIVVRSFRPCAKPEVVIKRV